MFAGAVSMNSQFQGAEHGRITSALHTFISMLSAKRREHGLAASQNPFETPANFVLAVTSKDILLAIEPLNRGSMPNHRYLDHRATIPPFSIEALLAASMSEPTLEYRNPIGLRLPLSALTDDEDDRRRALEPAATDAVRALMENAKLSQIQLPPGYEHYSRFIPAFLADHPDIDRTVFLMMRFRSGQQYKDIHEAIKEGFAAYGLKVLRADDRDFTGDLWENVCLYMLGCRYGVAVFDEIDSREFNPNISMELGFMIALNKRCLLLKDQRMSGLPTDVVGKLYRPFDTYKIQETITEAISKWAIDMKLPRATGSGK